MKSLIAVVVSLCIISGLVLAQGSGTKSGTKKDASLDALKKISMLANQKKFEEAAKVGEDALKKLPPGQAKKRIRFLTWNCYFQLLISKGKYEKEFLALSDEIVNSASQKEFEAVMPFFIQIYLMVGEADRAKALANKILKRVPESNKRVTTYVKNQLASMEKLGKTPPHFSLKDLAGKSVSPKDYKGKVLLIDFWASWCPPCKKEVPNIVRLYNKKRTEGFEIIGLSLDRNEKDLKNYIAEKGMKWRMVYLGGWKHPVVKGYGVRGIPSTFLVDRNGKLRYMGLRGPFLDRAVEKLLAEKTGKTKKGKL